MNLFSFLSVFIIFPLIHTFNVSPYPNLILKSPLRRTTRSSYFGFSLNLRKTHILIGAPRANTAYSYKEPGMIFKCTFDENCVTFNLDTYPSEKIKKIGNEFKDFQLLGFSMDGHETENDKFVACAPKHMTNGTEYYLFGVCYYVDNTASNQPHVYKIAPLRDNSRILFPDKWPNYAFGESGFSVHVTEDQNQIISGCPGVAKWKGSINQFDFYYKRHYDGYQGIVPDVTLVSTKTLHEDSYFGYAITSGKFLRPKSDFLFYVSSAPRKNYEGRVFIFYHENYEYKIYHTLKGDQYGSYFGYAIVCDDFNNDGKPDLAVSAPLFTEDGYHENGAVYIYLNQAPNEYVRYYFKKFDFCFILIYRH